MEPAWSSEKTRVKANWSNSKLIFIKLSNFLKSAYRGFPLPYSLFKKKNNKSVWPGQVDLSCPKNCRMLPCTLSWLLTLHTCSRLHILTSFGEM